MDEYEDSVEMELLQDQNPDDPDYNQLLHLMRKRHFAAFKSLVLRAINRDPHRFNINHQLSHPCNLTFLEVASREDLGQFIEFLIATGADPNRVNTDQRRSALQMAAERGCEEALTALLRVPGIKPNLEVSGLTALHLAVKGGHKGCVKLLLDNGASPNLPNSQGLTALHFAADKDMRDMVEIIVSRSQFLILDVFKDRKKETTRSIINRKYPDIKLPEASSAPSSISLLRYYLNANDEANFGQTLAEIKELENQAERIELMRLAVEKDLKQATANLLNRGPIEPGIILELGRIAIRKGCPETLVEVLKRGPRLASRLLLPAAQQLGIPVGPGPKSIQRRFECFKIVIGQEGVCVRQEDDKGNSALHYAARAECHEAVDLLLRRGCYIGHSNNYGVPALTHLPADQLEARLNDCVTCSEDRSENYEISLDYVNLVPHGVSLTGDEEEPECTKRPARACNETDPLLYIASHPHLRHLLKHPLLASFLYLKFLRIRHLLYGNFLLYATFYVVLNFYIWALTNDRPELDGKESSLNLTDSTIKIDSSFVNLRSHPILASLTGIGVLLLTARELLQLISAPMYYIFSPENWLEISLIGLTLSLLCGAGPEAGALAVLISTWELVLLLSQHPRMSTDIEMFKTVTLNFTKFLFLYLFLILAFALSFFVLFKGNENFPDPLSALFKTIVMLTGEFEAADLPFVTYPILSRLVFVGFIFLVVIILLNLLNGLAVNDTAEILAEAELVGLVARTRLIAYIERVVVGSDTPNNGGSPLLGNCCCWIPSLPLETLRQAPLRFVARRLLLFPRFLPQTRLSVKPLKKFEMRLHGKPESGKRPTRLRMDKSIARRAKEIIEARGRDAGADRQMSQLRSRLDAIETILREIKEAAVNERSEDDRLVDGFDLAE